jgi:hypothetical protein
MKYIPALFRGDMVRSILVRVKRETRRPDKNGKPPCAVGDRLWVRETWAVVKGFMDTESWEMPWIKYFEITGWPKRIPANLQPGHEMRYAADEWVEDERLGMDHPYPWRPSIHMPRWASRIELEVTDVRLEHVQDITDAGAIDEGVSLTADLPYYTEHFPEYVAKYLAWLKHAQKTGCVTKPPLGPGPRDRFAVLWDSIYGKTEFAWTNNPRVWVTTFKLVEVEG